MDLSTPLRSLAPSLESAVLEVLAGTESGLNASQIARLSRRGTRNGQAPVLNRLVQHGLVTADPTPTGHLFRLNRDHLLTPAVTLAVNARETFVERLRASISGLTPASVHSSLFGSFARRDGDADSDIDLLLVVPDDVDIHDDPWQEQVSVLGDRVLAWTGNRLETLTFTLTRFAELAAGDERIVDDWLDHGFDLTGTPLASLPGVTDRDASPTLNE